MFIALIYVRDMDLHLWKRCRGEQHPPSRGGNQEIVFIIGLSES